MFSTLQILNMEIEGCKECPLAKWRTRTVPGTGPADAEVMFIGEGPGPDEDAQGVPFIGRAGKVLRGIIGEVGLPIHRVFFANLVKCYPTDGLPHISRSGYQFRKPADSEIEACDPYLRRQIAIIRPKLVIPLGQVPTSQWFPGVTIGEAHGVLRATPEFLLAPTYHPSAIARGNTHLRELMLADVRRACELAGVLPQTQSRSGL